jgi:hypothetical protein
MPQSASNSLSHLQGEGKRVPLAVIVYLFPTGVDGKSTVLSDQTGFCDKK